MVSEPVITDAGVHLIKVSEAVREQDLPTLEALSEQIRADLKQGRAETLLNEDVARLEELLYEHSDMAVPAEQVGAEVQTTEWVALSALPAPLSAPQVQQALNSDQVRKDRHNSDLIETAPIELTRVGDGSLVAYQVTRVEDGNAEPLSDAQQQAALLELGNIEGQRNFRQVVALLRDEGDVELNLGRLSSNTADQ